ncbi:hypothetical protein F5Y11DRAFT_352340 [Daldinia sp. FL1419]|nr:hypothetical protein F5Y11DRAFT_352340 [Daldinia sp. FL1419]
MKFFIILALTTAALAKPYGIDPSNTEQCTPPDYICKSDFSGWLVCNVDGTFLDGGDCPPGTVCQYINDLPYCI